VYSLSVTYTSLTAALISAITVVVVKTNPFFNYRLNSALKVGLLTTDDYESLRFDV